VSAEWKRADRSQLTISWEDVSISFVCPCGEEIMLIDEPVQCDCGRRWRYVTQLQVQDAERTD